MSYVFEYENENDFRKKERSIKKYNMFAYKKLVFEYYPKIKSGDFLGKRESIQKEENITEYVLELPTDSLFAKIHGKMELHYTIDHKNKIILLTNLTPEDILLEGHSTELSTYKGVMVSKSHKEKDMFKINLLNMLENNRKNEK